MRGRLLKLITTLICISILVTVDPVQGMPGAQLQYPFFQKGMSYASWTYDGFSSAVSDKSIALMAESGVNCVAIVPTWYQDKLDSTEIKPTEKTPSDSGVRHAIRKAREFGMVVMLKPHLDVLNQEGSFRGDIGFYKPEEWEEWFGNYTKFITHYARLAEEEGAKLFSVGTELSFAATQTRYWKDMVIPAVRKEFSGHITYAANWDDYSLVEFWDELDYAGIDAYFPLTNNANPSFEDIRGGWSKWLAEIEEWQAKIKKPVVFTECGYCSADSAAARPWEEAVTGKPNTRLQADCYKAVFETFWDKPWFFGVYWWNWSTSSMAGGEYNRRFTPQNKLAMEYMKTWYGTPASMKFARNMEVEGRLEIESAKASMRYPAGERAPVVTGELARKESLEDIKK